MGYEDVAGTREHSIEKPLPDPIEGYTFIKPLGRGAFGTTYLAVKDGVQYAIKRLSLIAAQNEIVALGYLKGICKSHHILCYHEVFYKDDDGYIVTDYIEGSNLSDYITNNRQNITHDFIETLCTHLLDAMKTAFYLKVAHTDISMGNIMVTPQTDGYVFTLIDWGVASQGTNEYYYGPPVNSKRIKMSRDKIVRISDKMVLDLDLFADLLRYLNEYLPKRVRDLVDRISTYVNEYYELVKNVPFFESEKVWKFTSDTYDLFINGKEMEYKSGNSKYSMTRGKKVSRRSPRRRSPRRRSPARRSVFTHRTARRSAPRGSGSAGTRPAPR